MIYPQETAEYWAEKYDIEPSTGKCPKCGIDIIANIPFADGSLRGFISEDHGCGIEKTLATFVLVGKEKEDFLNILSELPNE